MHITRTNTSFEGGLRLNILRKAPQNKNVPYIDNQILNLVREKRLPAAFINDTITISFTEPKFQTKTIQETVNTLKKLGIFYKATK